MIWLYVFVFVAVMAGGWFVARTLLARLAVVGCVALAGAGYFIFGKPGMPDQPYADRVAEIERLATTEAGVASLNAGQLMAVFEKRAKADPKDPVPHIFMGKVLATTGRASEAMLAYESALRRDPRSIDAMVSLGDLLFESAAGISAESARYYRSALALQPDDVRLQFMVSLADFDEGKADVARAMWAKLEPPHFELVREVADFEYRVGWVLTPIIGELYRVAARLNPADKRVTLIAEALAAPADDPRNRFLASLQEFEEGKADAARSAWDKLKPQHFELVKEVTDFRFKATSQMTPLTGELYALAARLNPADNRIALMAGFKLWNDGKKAEAETYWTGVLAKLEPNDPLVGMYGALRQTFTVDKPAPTPPPN